MAIPATVLNLRCDSIIPDPDQPRKHFDQDALQQLAESLKSNGLLQPIVVMPLKQPQNGAKYILIAGERRWRAAGLLGWVHIPSIVKKNITMAEAVKLQLIENIVRQDLNPVEEARAYKNMLDEGYTLQELSETVGMAPSQIAWRVQMLNAREDVLELVARGHMKPSIAHELSKLSLNGQARALRAINSDKLSYNEVIALCQRIQAEEAQSEMFPETKVSEEHRKVARTFGEVFEKIGKLLCRLQEMDEESPGAIAEALALESSVAEAKVDEMLRGLYRVKKALQTRRMHTVAAGV